MADFSITLTVPDNKVTELVAALRDHYGEKSPGVAYTTAELRAKFKVTVEGYLQEIFRKYKRDQRDQQAAAGDVIGLT